MADETPAEPKPEEKPEETAAPVPEAPSEPPPDAASAAVASSAPQTPQQTAELSSAPQLTGELASHVAAPSAKPLPPPIPTNRFSLMIYHVRQYFIRRETIWAELPDMIIGLFSPDQPTRRMSFLFVFSLCGIALVIATAFLRSWNARKAVLNAEAIRTAQRIEKKARKESEEEKNKSHLVTVGTFNIEMNDVPTRKLNTGQVNMAEIEIVLLCDGEQTQNYFDQNKIPVKNQLTNLLIATSREEFLSRDGKKRLKSIIIRRLNEWLPEGRVEDVYFSKVVFN